jgi:coenzyme F420-0:L-glutamate ligase/coenzyme F420-1:gamma-L-glutamate ligase
MNVLELPTRFVAVEPKSARLIALSGIPLVKPGDHLAAIILSGLAASGERLRDGDVLVIAQKIVSKAQNRLVHLDTVTPSPEAETLAREVDKDPRVVELILRESTEIIRRRRGALIVAHRLGLVMANAGIDMSNVEQEASDDTALLLPEDPDATCASLRAELKRLTDADVAIIINDSHGRAFRNGTVGVAIGASGLSALADLRGKPDLFGRHLQITEIAMADELASAASLLMGQADEGRPVVLVRGAPDSQGEKGAAALIRPKPLDLFRAPDDGAVLNALVSRRSIRRYRPQPIANALIDSILQAATCAPSAHNRQPWRFAVVKDAVVKERLARAMGERLRADRMSDGDPAEAIAQDVARSHARITEAPIVIVVCLTMEDMDRYRDDRRNEAELRMAVQSTAMAMQNMLTAAHAVGLGSSVMCAPLFCGSTVQTTLNLASAWQPQALVTLGYPADAGKPFHRRPLAEVVRFVDRTS